MPFPQIQPKGTNVNGTTTTFSGFQAISIVNQSTSGNAVLTLPRGSTVRIKPGQTYVLPPLAGMTYPEISLNASACDCDVTEIL